VFAQVNVTIPDKRPLSLRLLRRHRAHRMHPRHGLVAAGALALLLASPAAAQETIPPDNSGADQYVAPVPDAGGNRPSGPGASRPGSLSPGARAALPSGSEGRLLARLATDPGSGAPSVAGGQASSGGSGSAGGGNTGTAGNGNGGGGNRSREADVTAASAITSSISDGGGAGVLVGGLVALTLGVAALRLVQHRRRRT
jgi:hypothetical protein